MYLLKSGHDFNPRSLAGATLADNLGKGTTRISIHAPLRERRYTANWVTQDGGISIHAPLRERPTQDSLDFAGSTNFNPRSLAGATGLPVQQAYMVEKFQSTLPCGSDSPNHRHYACLLIISIHAPLRERLVTNTVASSVLSFQSTLPCGSDISSLPQTSLISYFNPRSLAGATQTAS